MTTKVFKGTPAERLAMLRDLVANPSDLFGIGGCVGHIPADRKPKDWREARTVHPYVARFHGYPGNPYNPRISDARLCRHARWIEDTGEAGLRRLGFADELAGRAVDNLGWFTHPDGFPGEVYRGSVYLLPARKDNCGNPDSFLGSGRIARHDTGEENRVYVYGYDDPFNDGAAFLCFDNDATTEGEAARFADDVARVCAEREREYQTEESARIRREEIGDELVSIRADVMALCREARAVCGRLADAPRVRAAIRKRVERLLEEREELRNERDRLEYEPWTLFQH